MYIRLTLIEGNEEAESLLALVENSEDFFYICQPMASGYLTKPFILEIRRAIQ